MASGVSDAIESFIKALLQGDETQVELQRNELAARFGCAPSQINYVLSTRFTCEHGYRIESRRGGGGYVRVCASTPTRLRRCRRCARPCPRR